MCLCDGTCVFSVMFCVAYLWPGDIRDDTIEFCCEGRLVCRPWLHLQ